MYPTTTHPNSVAAAQSIRDSGIPKARADRRAITEQIARMGADGCTDEELARALPNIGPNSLRPRRGECQEFGVITASLGEMRKTVTGRMASVWHVTDAGIRALGLPLDSWCVKVGQ